ncbi:MAG: hypothetical protein OIF54_18950 [Cohaesibacter sp.]|nr:hypothetical protein [Cohaesibacter sp.]
MSLNINFFTTLSVDDLAQKLETIKRNHPDFFPSEFGISTEAHKSDDDDQAFIAEKGSDLKISSHFGSWPIKGRYTYSIEDMVAVVKSEFEPDQIVALWEMDYII